jgi:hypothetical protein
MEEIANFGTPTTKRISCRLTKPNTKWLEKCFIRTRHYPIQQYSYTVGKKLFDSAMIIDAMDLL